MGAKAQECTEQNFGPIGTGPFKVEEFRANGRDHLLGQRALPRPGQARVRDRHLQGWRRRRVRRAGGAGDRRVRLRVGGGGGNLQVEPEVLAQMAAAGKGAVVTAFGTSVERLMVNQTNDDPSLGPEKRSLYLDGANPHPFLSDPAVRRALSLAIDRHILVEAGYGAAGKPTCKRAAGPGGVRIGRQRRVPDAERRRGEPDPRRGGLDAGRRRRAGQGRGAPLDPLPDLDQLRAPGHPGAHQADVGADRGGDGAAATSTRRCSSAGIRQARTPT